MKEKTRKRYVYDAVLIVSILLVFLCLFFFVYQNRIEGTKAVVYVEGEPVATYSLLVEAEYELNGGTNILKIENGEAYMLHADCPRGICKNTGRKGLVRDVIDCRPNKVTVIIER